MDSDDEREEENVTWRGTAGTIVVINANEKNTATIAHAATCRMVRQYLRASNSRFVGVCLFGIEDSTKSSAFGSENVIDIVPLSTPTLQDFKNLRSLDILSYKQAKEFKLSDALWHCSKVFSNCKKLLSSRTIILLTRLDTPPILTDQNPTLHRVADLVDSNIDLRIINISQDDYQIDPFYIKFFKEVAKGGDYTIPKPIWECNDIEQAMYQQSHRHLAVANLNFEIGNGMSIGVGVYNLLIRPGSFFQKKVNLDRESNAIVASVTKTLKVTKDELETNFTTPMDVDEAEPKKMPLLKSEILYYQEFGGERVEITDIEKKKLQNPFGPPMMKLLGFKPASLMCKEKWFLKTGYFLFPNEGIIEGSTVAFKAMHQACVETATVVICVLCTRVNAKPNIVALIPCTHPLGLDVEIGFDVINIPFVENVRDLPNVEEDEETMRISEEQKTVMKSIFNVLQFDYKPDLFENPKLQSEYRAIEAIALEEDDLEPFVDTTMPDNQKFQSIPEDVFEELFGPFGVVASKRPASARVQSDSHEGAKRNKRQKNEHIDETTINDYVEYETVHKFTMDELKKILKQKQDPTMPALSSLKKPELVSLVYKYYS